MQAITIVMPVNLGSESLYSKRQDGKRGGGKKGWTFHPCFLLALKDPGKDKATNKKMFECPEPCSSEELLPWPKPCASRKKGAAPVWRVPERGFHAPQQMTCNAVTLNRVLLFVHPFIYYSVLIRSFVVVHLFSHLL